MKRTALLIAVTIAGFLAAPRGAVTWTGPDIRDLGTKILAEETAPPEEDPFSIFNTLVSFAGKIGNVSAAPIGGYMCKDGQIQFNPKPAALQLRRELDVDLSLFLARAPIKFVITATGQPDKSVLVLGRWDGTRDAFSIVQSAKLTNRTVNVQAAAVPGCQNAYFLADVTY